MVRHMEQIIYEAFQTRTYDIVISVLGNGTSTLGMIRALKDVSPHTQIIGFESFLSAAAYSKKYPLLFEKKFNLTPHDVLHLMGRHTLP